MDASEGSARAPRGPDGSQPSAIEDPGSDDTLAEPPGFELACLVDDPNDPAELTVFSPDGESIVTEWVTVDWSTAMSLEQVR